MISKITTIADSGSSGTSEDVLLLNREHSFFGVFDGATSLTKYVDPSGKTGGRIAAEIAEQAFSTGQPKETLVDCALRASHQIEEAMITAGVDTTKAVNRWGTTAAVIKLKPHSFEWLVVGDSSIVIVMEDGSCKEATPYHDHDVQVLTLWKKFADEKAENIRALIAEDLVALREQSNISYGVINGDEAVSTFLRSGEEQMTGVKHLLLFTDGLLLPNEDPGAPKNYSAMVSLYQTGGLEEIKKDVRKIEASDPNCWRYPRYKQHDDIAAIALTVAIDR
jgi:serine/threonine protein phosphatase PrpC